MGAVIWQKVTTCNTTGGATIMGSFPYPRPAGYAYIPQIINELEFQRRTHQIFTEKYGGKVFYIISVKQDKKKVIHNTEVIEEIRQEIVRLEMPE